MTKSIARILVGLTLYALSQYAARHYWGMVHQTFDTEFYYGTDYDVGRLFAFVPTELARKPCMIRHRDHADRVRNFVAMPLYLISIPMTALGVATLIGTTAVRAISFGRRCGPGRLTTPTPSPSTSSTTEPPTCTETSGESWSASSS